MMCRSESGIRWWTSATRPATEFSTAIIASAARPSLTAANASSNWVQGKVVISGKTRRQARSEYAPKVPWNAIVCCVIRLMHLPEQFAGANEIGRSVDLHPEPGGLDQADRDVHPGFERAQLLETLALFEHAPGQTDKALERLASIGVEPDMLVVRSFSPRHYRLAEIERACGLARVNKSSNHLVDAGIRECGLVFDYRSERGDVDFGVRKAGKRHANCCGIQEGQIALYVDYGIKGAVGVELRDRCVDAVRSGRVAWIGHDCPPAGCFDRIGNRLVAAGDDDRADLCGDRTPPDMHDHRHPAHLRQRLARQAARGEPGGDQNDRVLWCSSGHDRSLQPIG